MPERNNRRCFECFVKEERPKESLLCGIAKQKRHQPQQIHTYTSNDTYIAFEQCTRTHSTQSHLYHNHYFTPFIDVFSVRVEPNTIVTHTDTKKFFFLSPVFCE